MSTPNTSSKKPLLPITVIIASNNEMKATATVLITFRETEQGIKLVETFDAEDEHTAEQQKQGWQAILNNFKQYVENKNG